MVDDPIRVADERESKGFEDEAAQEPPKLIPSAPEEYGTEFERAGSPQERMPSPVSVRSPSAETLPSVAAAGGKPVEETPEFTKLKGLLEPAFQGLSNITGMGFTEENVSLAMKEIVALAEPLHDMIFETKDTDWANKMAKCTPKEQQTLLVFAIRRGQLDRVEKLLAQGAEPDGTLEEHLGLTPLHWATLLARRDAHEGEGPPAAALDHIAATLFNASDSAQYALTRDVLGNTALHYATALCHEENISLLASLHGKQRGFLTKVADTVGYLGSYAMIWFTNKKRALKTGHVGTPEFKVGADLTTFLNARNRDGLTPILVAAENADVSPHIIPTLMALSGQGSDDLESYVQQAAASVLRQKITGMDVAMGAVGSIGLYGKLVLPPAGKTDDDPIRAVRRSLGAEDYSPKMTTDGLEPKDAGKVTQAAIYAILKKAKQAFFGPLFAAAVQTTDKMARMGGKQGLGVDLPEDAEFFRHAIMGDNLRAIDSFLLNGGDVLQRDASGMLPLHWAIMLGKEDAASLLLMATMEAWRGNRPSVAPLRDATQRGVDDKGRTLFHLAAMSGDPKMISFVKRIIPDDINTTDNEGMSPLFYAAANGHWEIFQALVDTGADVRAFQDQAGTLGRKDLIDQQRELTSDIAEKEDKIAAAAYAQARLDDAAATKKANKNRAERARKKERLNRRKGRLAAGGAGGDTGAD